MTKKSNSLECTYLSSDEMRADAARLADSDDPVTACSARVQSVIMSTLMDVVQAERERGTPALVLLEGVECILASMGAYLIYCGVESRESRVIITRRIFKKAGKRAVRVAYEYGDGDHHV